MLFLTSKQNYQEKNKLKNKSKKTTVLLSLGSNLGVKVENIKRAINYLKNNNILENIKVSSFYETEPVGFKNQPIFLNCAIVGKTRLTPFELLEECKKIEKELGRQDRPKWHEREIDLDIILYGNKILNTESLSIPHPQAEKRRFVLIPANEIASQLVFPTNKKTVNQLLQNCCDNSRVTKINFESN